MLLSGYDQKAKVDCGMWSSALPFHLSISTATQLADSLSSRARARCMTKSNDVQSAAAAVAALAICEALLLALNDLKLMSVKRLRDVVDDATAAHRDADPTQDPAVRRQVVAILKKIKSSVQTIEHS